ncbi:MAG: CesT family type III secretion system chaperone [Simkaniaceae bacterium]|nr:CesT family type III secretion system chaperone [Simkaniaceae bacterium]
MTPARFHELIRELGETTGIPFDVDRNHVCRILFEDTLTVQLEPSSREDTLFIGALLSPLPPGKFREKVLHAALQVNGDETVHAPIGTLAYIERNNLLALQAYLPEEGLTGERVARFLEEFVTEAESWCKAIANSEPAPAHHLTKRNTRLPPPGGLHPGRA